MSFFDEADEPRTEPTAKRRRRATGGGRRPPSEEQAIRARRAVALVILLIVVILIVVGVSSCQSNARKNALRDYNNNVSTIITESNQTGQEVFDALSNTSGSGGAVGVQSKIAAAANRATNELNQAKKLNVPDEVKKAQQYFEWAMQARSDGISGIANQVQPALSNATSKDAVNQIAADMANFYASDVLYKSYTLPLIAGALKGAGIATSGANAQTFNGDQFLPDVQWLTSSYVANQLKVSIATAGRQADPRAARALTGLGQRRGNHAADRVDQHTPSQPAAAVHAELHQRRHQHRAQRQLQGLGEQHQHHGEDDRGADHPRSARHLLGHAQRLAAGRELHRDRHDRQGPR